MDISSTHDLYLQSVDAYISEFLAECEILNYEGTISDYIIESFMADFSEPELAARAFILAQKTMIRIKWNIS